MNQKRDYTAREIARLSSEEVWALPVGGLRITFDDGETVKCYTYRVIQSWYYWRLFEEYGTKGLTSDFYIGTPDFNTETHVKYASKTFWAVFLNKAEVLIPGCNMKEFWDLGRRIYQVGNEIYNDSCIKDARFISTLDIMDLVQIFDAPEIEEAKEKFRTGEYDADQSHADTYAFMSTDKPEFKYNEVVRGCRAGLYNRRQITHLIGPRAIIPEINGDSFGSAIDAGHAEGLDSFYDRAIESRTASIAYYMSKAPLEDSEYNNRMCQFLTGVIGQIEYTDCCSEHYVEWVVRERDIKGLIGKFMMVDGKPVLIMDEDDPRVAVGQTIHIRSICACNNKDRSRPCAVCAGISAWTTPPGTYYGHHMTIEPLTRISQTILSIKHVIASTKSVYLRINESNVRLVSIGEENPHLVYLKADVSNKGYRQAIRIPVDEVLFLNDINSVEDLASIHPYRISSCNHVQFIEYAKNGCVKVVSDFDVSVGGKGSPLTMAMLEYMKAVGWDAVADSIEVDLTGWDYNSPFVITPRRGEDIMTVLRDIQNFMHSPNKVGVIRARDFEKPGAAIQALMDLMNKKISVNFAQAEVFVRALMTKVDNEGKPTFELPGPDDPFIFTNLKKAIMNRNLGAALGFERQVDLLFNPGSYLSEDKFIPGSELDILWNVV